ncbi:MAG: zinc-binding dehydrogenase [Candidatus Nanopelagicales bacterium]|jgi:NADPH:quinone reductase-like Zn-dependent oxidoreductase|nr:zinc-binding dehydrogenase [Candidatus Nanopelagicales bacterium]
MRAVVIREHGDVEVLNIEDMPTPEPGVGEVRIRVGAVSVNSFLDVSNRAGKVPFASYSFPHILGVEHAGVVDSVGGEVPDWVTPGTRVVVQAAYLKPDGTVGLLGVHREGSAAEYSVVPVSCLRPLPGGVSFVEAAALALNGPLAVRQLQHAGFEPGEWVLVQAAASAAGSMMIKVLQHLGGRIIATSRDEGKRERLRELGVEHVLDTSAVDLAAQVHAITGAGADLVVDNIGDPTLWRSTIASLRDGGRVVTSGAKFGGEVPLDVRDLYTRNLSVLGVRTYNPPAADRLWDLVQEGLRPVISDVFPLESVRDAHRCIENQENVGRVVLSVWEEGS